MLVFEIEFLTSVSVAASPFHREMTEWPPHPDRLFQALVASWGRNTSPDFEERSALEWMENLGADSFALSAPLGLLRDVTSTFVPPNDAVTTGKYGSSVPKKIGESVYVIPELRKNRQPRSFPSVTLPQDEPSRLHYIWKIEENESQSLLTHKPALKRLAREVTYLGHSHSLVRVAVVDTMPEHINLEWYKQGKFSLRMPYPGRLAALESAYKRSLEVGQIIRPKPSLAHLSIDPVNTEGTLGTLFDPSSIIVLADAGGSAPTLAAFPLVARRLRDALLKSCQKLSLSIPALLSGHDHDGKPNSLPHLAIVPLADVGWSYSSGRLMGLGLIWPRDSVKDDKRVILLSLAAFLNHSAEQEGILHFGKCGSWKVALAQDSHLASLRTNRYVQKSRRWGSVLPVVLDRHPKNKDGSFLADIIAHSCLNAGLPPHAVDGIEVELHKHSPIKCAPSVKEVGASLSQDSPYRGRAFAHLAITFTRPISGPLLLGAGRFRGLGLCLPLDGGMRNE